MTKIYVDQHDFFSCLNKEGKIEKNMIGENISF